MIPRGAGGGSSVPGALAHPKSGMSWHRAEELAALDSVRSSGNGRFGMRRGLGDPFSIPSSSGSLESHPRALALPESQPFPPPRPGPGAGGDVSRWELGSSVASSQGTCQGTSHGNMAGNMPALHPCAQSRIQLRVQPWARLWQQLQHPAAFPCAAFPHPGSPFPMELPHPTARGWLQPLLELIPGAPSPPQGHQEREGAAQQEGGADPQGGRHLRGKDPLRDQTGPIPHGAGFWELLGGFSHFSMGK